MIKECVYDRPIMAKEHWTRYELERLGVNTDIILNSNSPGMATIILGKLVAVGMIPQDYDKALLRYDISGNVIQFIIIPEIQS